MAMEPLILVCEGCRVRIRVADPWKARNRDCPRCSTPLAGVVDRTLGLVAPVLPVPARSIGRLVTGTVAVLVTIGSVASLLLREPSIGASTDAPPGPVAQFSRSTCPVASGRTEPPVEAKPLVKEANSSRRPLEITPPRPPSEIPHETVPPIEPAPTPDVPAVPAVSSALEQPGPRPDLPRRVLVKDRKGQAVVAREHGMLKDRMAVILPDGQIGWVDGQVTTDRPFVPLTMDEVRDSLRDDPEFATFKLLQTDHYLIYFQGGRPFAQASADLLERLHDGLTGALKKHGLPVAPVEFPLVAVIFADEDEFRSSRRVAPDVQAYYEILSNRIYFYEKSRRDQHSPEVSALRKPQTVAHEGTHQILHNVGLQPRLSDWPLWLVEGFAEYCSPPRTTKKGGSEWAGLGQVNPIHMATIRDLDDPASTQVRGPKSVAISRDRARSLVEYLVTRKDLTPTDYALSWALTHYLARERLPEFVAYMKRMSELKPFEGRTPDQQLASFLEVFGDDPVKMDAKVAKYLSRLKTPEALPYFSVVFEQPVGPVIRRMAMVSQSPSVIRQWIESASSPEGGLPHWQALPYRSRATALHAAEQFLMQGN
ncbi:DUF1570 domain-containing protein [Tundrisphaera lichenicola]|uniref:DUF1570 domain-containing protein n=1 Tax=Tundrisphaera lichenicola TaxID=2029860 RepID=UPI003EB6C56F